MGGDRVSQIKIERRYVWEVPGFTPRKDEHGTDLYNLLVVVDPGSSTLANGATLFRRVEVYDAVVVPGPHLVDLRERVTARYAHSFTIRSGLSQVLGDALYDGQLRGRVEEAAVWALVWAVMTERGRSSALAREWVPEWAAWLDGLKEPVIPVEGA